MKRIKIGWILAVDRSHASTRLQGYLIHEWFIRNGIESQIIAINSQNIKGINDPNFWNAAKCMRTGEFSHVVFESPEWPIFQLSQLWKLMGGISICVRCDYIEASYDEYFDSTILPTVTLAETLKILRPKIIPDSVEAPLGVNKKNYASSGTIKIVWMGHQSYENYLKVLIENLNKNFEIRDFFEFQIISKGAFATKQWAEDTVFQDIIDGDVAILPIPQGDWFKSKSSNRLALMMALGMPTIASRISSYTEIGTHGANVVFVNDESGFVEALISLKNEVTRSSLGRAANKEIAGKFSIEKIGPLWYDAIFHTIDSSKIMHKPSIKLRLILFFMGLTKLRRN